MKETLKLPKGCIKKRIQIPIYGDELVLIQINADKIMSTDPTISGAFAYAIEEEDHYIIVFTNTVSPGIIAHECLHIVHMIMESKGFICDLANDEAECYLLGWIVDECFKHVRM